MRTRCFARKFAFFVQLTSVLDIISTSSSAVAQNLSILANEVLQFVNDGGEIVDSYGQHEEIILVLGDEGSGKSTLTAYMADEMEYLYARRTRGEYTSYAIRDSRNKQKREDAATQQVIPRLVEDYRLKRIYFDCPAFGGAHSDVSVHFLRKVVAAAKLIKMVFVVDYECVKASSPSAPFLGVVADATGMLHAGKFLAAAALVVTKVDNDPACENDDEIIEKEILVFLSRVRDELSASQDKDGMAFVNTLLERNREGSFTRIGLFRRPDRAGPLKYSRRLGESRRRLDATVHDNIKFVKRDPSDIIFRRPDMLEAYANELVRKAQEDICNGVQCIADDIRKHYIWRERVSDDVIALQDLFLKGSQLFSDAIEVESMAAFIANVKRIARTSNILISAKNVMAVRRYNEFLDYLCTEPDASTGCARVFVLRSKPYSWNQSMLATVEYLNNSKTWYEFLVRLIERLSAYNVNRDLKLPLEVTVDDLRRLHKQSLDSPLPESIETMKVDKLKLRFLKPILSVAFYKPLVSVAGKTLTVQGAFVKLSDVVKLAAFTNPKTRTVRVFALDTVFLDAHVDLTGREMTVLILAPTWEFVCDSHFLLDGQAGRGHNATQSTAGPSTDGLPGKAGGPAGHFFGIGATFVSLPSVLRIEASGGKGGPGQGGCPGQRGQHGEDCIPLQAGKWWVKGWHRRRFLGKSKYRKELREGSSLYFHTAATNSTKYIRVLGVKMSVKCKTYHYNCTGQIGREGGAGGAGGAGGKGGLMGTVELLDMTKRIVFNCTKSADGCFGAPGPGSARGCRGDQGISYAATFEEYRTPFAIYYRRPGIQNVLVEPSAEPCRQDNCIPGRNTKNMQSPRRYDFANPIRTVVDYKKVAREYALQAQINPLNAPINTFVNLIEADPRVNVYDHTRAFIYDLFALENQFYSLHAKTSTLSCYEALARRILRYADNASGRLSATDKVILSHVYSAVLSKISALKRNRNFLVMDFDRYCKSVLTEIKSLNKLNHIEMINEYKIKYENLMNRKIDEAQRFIDETIIPTIEDSFKNTGETLQMLLDENDDYKGNARDYEIELKKTIRQRKSTLVARRTLSVMLFGAQFLQFLGPVGAIAGTAVEGASMVATSLISPNMDKVKKARAKNMAKVHATLLKNSELLESHRVRLRKEMTYITQEVKKAEERQSADLTFLTVEIEKHEQRLKELETRQDEVVPFWILTRVQDEFKARVTKLLENKQKEYDSAQKSTKEDKRSSDQMDAVRRVKRVIRISADMVDLIMVGNKQGDDQSEMDLERLESELDDVSKQLTRLHNYERMITDVFVPLCDKVYTEMRNWEAGLHNQSSASLHMSQWKVQFWLTTIKKTLRDMTDGYETQNVIVESIDQIEEGLTKLVDMYDLIQKYHEKVELEAYIANINSYRETGPLDDPEIDRLNALMRSNVILNLFNNAMDAFKQAIFPFAHLYFEDMGTLPDSLRIENNTDVLVKEAISRINNLNEKKRQVSSQLYDLYDNAIMKDVPFTLDRSLTPPFYEWEFKAKEYVIQKLLSGSTVTLTSHITKARVDDNAVKFKNLRMRLILTAHTSQQAKFDQLLENYIFELTHSGEMYFRCGRRFYFVRCNSMKMAFSFKSKASGEPESANSIYGRIKDNYYALSPYTTWNVKLVKNKYWTGDIGALGKFANYPMKIVLEGLGEFVKRDIDHEICNANLSKYYDSIIL